MEDLSLDDAAAQCQFVLRSSRANSLIRAASPCRSEAPDECRSMESDAEAHMETLAVAQLRNLEAKLVRRLHDYTLLFEVLPHKFSMVKCGAAMNVHQ